MYIPAICAPDTCPEQATCTVVNKFPVCECRCDAPECEEEGEVCGTDGQTYNSRATLMMTACNNRKNIVFAYRGQCQSKWNIL